ncbi:MAG: hypothetical protein AB7N61_24610 [Acidimicrobiia bacterium]
MTVTDPAHVDTARQLRENFIRPPTVDDNNVDELTRDLADYDRAFGIDGIDGINGRDGIDGREVA